MEFNIIDEKLINAYVVLKMADKLGNRVVPIRYIEEVEIRVANETIDVLEGDNIEL